MMPTHKRFAGIALFCLAASTPCLATSLGSSASDAGSASLGSVSDSLTGSSNSSSGETKPVAAGDYRVVDVAAVAERPGMLRVRLQATAQPGAGNEFWLVLPEQALAQRMLVAGDIVIASTRPYGVEFARADGANGREAFYLVLADDWHKELDPRANHL